MAGTKKKIYQLDTHSSIVDTDVFPISAASSGSAEKIAASSVKSYVKTGLTTADVTESTDKNYVTNAQVVILGNTSGTNTGDQDLSGYVTKTGTETITNKTFDDSVTHKQVTTPSNPSSGYNKLYFKSDDKLYKKSAAGVETEIGAGTGTGDVTGPGSSTTNHIPQFADTTGKLLKDGLGVVTTLGSPGVDTNIPTEAAVRAAIAGAGGGDVSGPSSATADAIVLFSGTSGKTIKDSVKTITTTLGTTDTSVPTSKAVNDVVVLKQNIFVGIDEATPVTVSIDYTTRVLTVTPTGATFNFYVDGGGVVTKFTKTGAQAFPAFTDTSGLWHFYFDATGNPITTQTAWTDFSVIAPIYRINWNSAKTGAAKSITEWLETHPNTISAADHAWKHTYGAVWTSGLDIATNFIATGTPNADGRNTVIALTSGKCTDDNLVFTHTNGTGTNLFEQDLGNTTPASLNATNSGVLNIRYKGVAGASELVTGSRFPFLFSAGNVPEYVNTSGARTTVTNNYYFVYFVYQLGDQRNTQGIRLTPSYGEYSTLANAQAITWDTIKAQDAGANDNEIRPLYRLIFEYKSTYDVGCKYSVLREITDIRKTVVTQTTVSAGTLPASSVSVVPAGNISSTNTQSALEELDNEKLSTAGFNENLSDNHTSGATGDIRYRNSSGKVVRLALGTSGKYLKSDGSTPLWDTVSASGGAYWTAVPGTPTRVDNTSFTVTDTGNTNKYDLLLQRGTCLKWTESGAIKQAMVGSATYATDAVTVVLMGDTMASIDAGSLKYGYEKARTYKFAVAGTIGATGTNVANTIFPETTVKLFGADIWAGTAGNGTTTVDINRSGGSVFSTKPSITTTNQYSFGTSANNAIDATPTQYLTIDVDAVAATTKIVDLYVNLYYTPLYNTYLA